MTAQVDYLIVGSGLTGASIARTLADAGKSVVVLERRGHVGGNVHDWMHPSGIAVHTYGPHYFRTNSTDIWEFVNRFDGFFLYEAALQSYVDGAHEHWPVTRGYIERTVRGDWELAAQRDVATFEDACLAMMPREVYEKFVRGYTEKQWGVPAAALSKELAGRFEVRDGDDLRLSRHRFQGIPVHGYARFMQAMLAGIEVETDHLFAADRTRFAVRKRVVYTGPIDEYFAFALGRLTYRGQRREHRFYAGVDWHQPCGQVNNPDPANGPHIRTLEWKHMMPPQQAQRISGSVVTSETPFTPDDPADYEYPFPDARNRELYAHYRSLAAGRPDVLFCGRLGEYRYYDMDQAIARARLLAGRLLADG